MRKQSTVELTAASQLAAVPSLDDVLRHPACVHSLPGPTLAALLAQTAAVQSALTAALLSAPSEPQPRAESVPDRMLTPEEAGVILHEPPRWFYRHRLPFIHRINRRKILISENGLRRWIVGRKSA